VILEHCGGRCIVLRSLDLKMQENTQEIREMGATTYKIVGLILHAPVRTRW
jgi:hypothetical protein